MEKVNWNTLTTTLIMVDGMKKKEAADKQAKEDMDNFKKADRLEQLQLLKEEGSINTLGYIEEQDNTEANKIAKVGFTVAFVALIILAATLIKIF